MSTTSNYPTYGHRRWKAPVINAAALPSSANNTGDTRIALDSGTIYYWTGSAWTNASGLINSVSDTNSVDLTVSSGVLTAAVKKSAVVADSGYTIVSIDEQTDGIRAQIAEAGASNEGSVSTSTQTFAGNKTFNNDLNVIGSLSQGSIAVSLNKQQQVTVAKAGGQYSSIQSAINAISDATAIKPYVVLISPGVYAETITLKPFVHLTGVGNGTAAPIITGKISGTFTNAGEHTVLNRIGIQYTLVSDGEIVVDVTGGLLANDIFAFATTTSDYGCELWKVNSTTFPSTLVTSYLNITNTYDGSTKNYTGIHALGAYEFSQSQTSVDTSIKAASGTIIGRLVESTDGLKLIGNSFYSTITKASFAGTAIASSVTSVAASGQIRISDTELFKFIGISGGTAIAAKLDSSGSNAEMQYVGSVCFIDGFTTSYTCSTALGDTQKVWLQSSNKDIGSTGTGMSVITPYVYNQTGFVAWTQDPTITTYWTYTTGTRLFKVDKNGIGIVKGTPVAWVKDQTVTLTDLSINYVYVTSSGVVSVSTSAPDVENYIMLFEVWVEGTNYIVTRENHPVEFTASISKSWHNVFGNLLQSSSSTLAINSGANRTWNFVGSNTINDHGITTSISTTTPVTFTSVVQNTSTSYGYMIGSGTGLISKLSAANNTGTNCGNNKYINFRLGVIKESLNTSTPQFIAFADSTEHANSSAAASQIAANSLLAFPAEIKGLEICKIGFATVQADGAGAGTLTSVTTDLQIFTAAFLAGGTSTSGGLITLNTTNFDKILSGTDTSVQTAMETIDENATKRVTSTTDNAVVRFDSTAGLQQNSGVIIDDSNNMTGLLSTTSATLYGSNAASGNLVLRSTSNATKGYIYFGDLCASVSGTDGSTTLGKSLASGTAYHYAYIRSREYDAAAIGFTLFSNDGSSGNIQLNFGCDATNFFTYQMSHKVGESTPSAGHSFMCYTTRVGYYASDSTWTLGKSGNTTTHAMRGGLSTTYPIQCADGAVGTPSFTFTNDLDCGMYRIGTNNIGISTNGALMIDIGPATLGFFGTAAVSRPVSADPAAVTTTETSGASYTSNEQDMLTHLKADVTELQAKLKAVTDALQGLGLTSAT